MSKKILLLEHSPEATRKISTFLSEMGYAVKTCDDAKQAISFTLTFKPDLILANASLPVISGTELARLFKSHEKLSPIPFLLMAYRRPDVPGLAAHQRFEADDYITLPLDPTKLYAAVTKWLETDERPSSVSEEAVGPLREEEETPQATNPYHGKITPINLIKAFHGVLTSPVDGCLRAKSERRKMKITVVKGKIADVTTNHIREASLGRLLRDEGKITNAEHEASVARAQKGGKKQGEILVKLGFLGRDELMQFLRKQKERKLYSLFDKAWSDGHFEFRPEAAGEIDEPSLDLPIAEFLRSSVIDQIETPELFETFARNEKQDSPIHRSERFEEVARQLGLKSDHLQLIRRIEGHSLRELKNSRSDDYENAIAMTFLLTVTKGLSLGPKPAAAKEAPAARAAAEPERAAETEVLPVADVKDFMRALRNGQRYCNAEDFTAAEPWLEKACVLNDQSSEALALLAWCKYSQADKSDLETFVQVKEMLKKAISLDDRDDLAHFHMGQVLKAENKHALAAAHFRTAVSLNPMNEQAQRELRLIEARLKAFRDKSAVA